MTSVVIDLQKDSMNVSVKVSDLLRKAYVVARKLDLVEFRTWIEQELNGYDGEIPDYRVAYGQIRAWNPYNGWIPIMFEDPRDGDAYSKRGCDQSIAELEHLIENRGPKSTLHIPFPQAIQRQLCKSAGFETEITLFVNPSALIKIIDSVRNIILNWALKLEEEGILGEGLSFSDQEKSTATSTPQNVNHFYGPVSSPQIQQGNESALQISSTTEPDFQGIESFLKALKAKSSDLDLDVTEVAEIASEVTTLEAQIASPNPKSGIVNESLKSIRTILESASGSAAGQTLLELLRGVFG